MIILMPGHRLFLGNYAVNKTEVVLVFMDIIFRRPNRHKISKPKIHNPEP